MILTSEKLRDIPKATQPVAAHNLLSIAQIQSQSVHLTPGLMERRGGQSEG